MSGDYDRKMTTVELRIRNGGEIRVLTATAGTYAAARTDVDTQVPDGWQKLLYFQR